MIEGNIAIYPNPAKNDLQIQMDTNQPYEVRVQNMLGQTLENEHFSGNGELSLSSYISGQYILQIIQNERITIKKFVKE